MPKLIINKPWGREKIIEHNKKYALKILEVDPGKRLSLQYHKEKHETMYCLYGRGILYLTTPDSMEESIYMSPGKYITIKPGDIHRLEAAKNSPLVIMEASSPELDDVVRIEDDYDREKKA